MMSSVKDELILALEENGYAEKEFFVIASPAFGTKESLQLFAKEGVMHKVRFFEEKPPFISISFVYLINSDYYDAVISLDTTMLSGLCSINKLMNGLIESFSEIEKHLNKVMKDKSFVLFEVSSYDRPVYHDDPFGACITFSFSNKKVLRYDEFCYYTFILKTTKRKLIDIICRDDSGKNERVFSCSL